MTAPHIVGPAGLLGEALSEASPDLMRQPLQTMINALLSADADAVLAPLGEPDRPLDLPNLCDAFAHPSVYRGF